MHFRLESCCCPFNVHVNESFLCCSATKRMAQEPVRVNIYDMVSNPFFVVHYHSLWYGSAAIFICLPIHVHVYICLYQFVRLRGLAVACCTTDHYHPCSNPGVGISEGCFVFHFVSLPLEVARPI